MKNLKSYILGDICEAINPLGGISDSTTLEQLIQIMRDSNIDDKTIVSKLLPLLFKPHMKEWMFGKWYPKGNANIENNDDKLIRNTIMGLCENNSKDAMILWNISNDKISLPNIPLSESGDLNSLLSPLGFSDKFLERMISTKGSRGNTSEGRYEVMLQTLIGNISRPGRGDGSGDCILSGKKLEIKSGRSGSKKIGARLEGIDGGKTGNEALNASIDPKTIGTHTLIGSVLTKKQLFAPLSEGDQVKAMNQLEDDTLKLLFETFFNVYTGGSIDIQEYMYIIDLLIRSVRNYKKGEPNNIFNSLIVSLCMMDYSKKFDYIMFINEVGNIYYMVDCVKSNIKYFYDIFSSSKFEFPNTMTTTKDDKRSNYCPQITYKG